MTIQPIATAFTKRSFVDYVNGTVEPRMGAWRPRGVVLHNTGLIPPANTPSVQNFYHAHGQPLPGPQRIRNMWESYIKEGWSGGPHLVITDKEIFAGNPLWLKGTHSPFWNATFWGIEMVGDYDVEKFPDGLLDLASTAAAALYAMLGHEPNNDTFHLHKEDPLTKHKRCPGVNCGNKQQWIERIRNAMVAMHPGGHEVGPHPAQA